MSSQIDNPYGAPVAAGEYRPSELGWWGQIRWGAGLLFTGVLVVVVWTLSFRSALLEMLVGFAIWTVVSNAVPLGASVLVACGGWLLGAPRENARTRIIRHSGWTLRVITLIYLALQVTLRVQLWLLPSWEFLPLYWLPGATAFAVLPLAFFQVSALYSELGLPLQARRARTLGLVLAIAVGAMVSKMHYALAFPIFAVLGISLLFALFDVFRRTRAGVHEWWLDSHAGGGSRPQTELVVLGKTRTLVRTGGGRRECFSSYEDAAEWLEAGGFVRATGAERRRKKRARARAQQ